MSGTSMDGIDASFVETDGDTYLKNISNHYIKYNKNEKIKLFEIQKKYLTDFVKKKDATAYNEIITNLHYQAIKKIAINHKIDFVGFHGQTVLHNANKKISLQLGNPQKLSNLTNLKIISCFRADDINKGGQGAPLAPIFHKFLIKKNKLELPSLFLNIGGVSNITYYDKEHLIGFDVGPGNGLIDLYMRSKFNKNFDQNGEKASFGMINEDFINKFKLNKFHKLSYPKSLDITSFKKEYNELLSYDLKANDVLATLTELTVISIQNSLDILPKKIKDFVIVGGGLHNKYLINRLKQTIDARFISPKEISLDEDFVESEMIAYISARKIKNLPVTFPYTTGVTKPLVIGKIFYPIKNH